MHTVLSAVSGLLCLLLNKLSNDHQESWQPSVLAARDAVGAVFELFSLASGLDESHFNGHVRPKKDSQAHKHP